MSTRVLRKVPWYAKMAAKVAISRIPIAYSFKARLGVFRHGAMDQADYAYAVFQKHYQRAALSKIRNSGWVALELGPGDSLASAVIARAMGASRIYLVDVGSFASRDVQVLRNVARYLAEKGFAAEGLEACNSTDEVLQVCRAKYLTEGIRSLRSIAGQSVDFVFSNAVLEHVRLHEFAAVCAELRRVQRKEGVGSHTIDFADHFEESLNNLRFSQSLWESEWMASSGFYTNRIRPAEMCGLFEKAGFQTEIVHRNCWPQVPLAKSRLAPPFRNLSDDELMTHGLDVLLR